MTRNDVRELLVPYALGELDAETTEAVRRLVEADAALSKKVETLISTVTLLSDALTDTPAPRSLSADRRKRIVLTESARETSPPQKKAVRAWLMTPQKGLGVLAAAAALLVIVTLAGMLLPKLSSAPRAALKGRTEKSERYMLDLVDELKDSSDGKEVDSTYYQNGRGEQSAAEGEAAERVAFRTKLPKARFNGTPRKLESANFGLGAERRDDHGWEEKSAPAPQPTRPGETPPPPPPVEPKPSSGPAPVAASTLDDFTVNGSIRAPRDADGDGLARAGVWHKDAEKLTWAGAAGGAEPAENEGKMVTHHHRLPPGQVARVSGLSGIRVGGDRGDFIALDGGATRVDKRPANGEDGGETTTFDSLGGARVSNREGMNEYWRASLTAPNADTTPLREQSRRNAPGNPMVTLKGASLTERDSHQAKRQDVVASLPDVQEKFYSTVKEDRLHIALDDGVSMSVDEEVSSVDPFGAEPDDQRDGGRILSEPAEDARKPDSHFRAHGVNPIYATVDQPFSTFSIDVDTAAYTVGRRYMSQGFLPPAEAVRTEEFVNFFEYGYKAPLHRTFRVYADCAPSRFGRGLHLLKIGVKGRRLGREEQRRAVLTFLIDTSGSMDKPDRLGLVQRSLTLLVSKLSPEDRVAIIQYSSHARIVIEHTAVGDRKAILAAIDALQCGGSTNLEEGMRRAYQLAAAAFATGAENRVLLLSDGVANLGTGDAAGILKQVERYRKQGITCSVFGFGTGTYDDEMLETLANKGDGNYTFIDSEEQAQRVFVDDLAATLNTIASDVKIQVQFNPKRVKRYRQLGYENRQLAKEDFRNDAVDAGEIGSGQSVTALYEVELSGGSREPLGVVRVRYRRVDTGAIEEIAQAIRASDVSKPFNETDAHFRLATCVAEFAEILRGSPYAAGSECEDVAMILRPVALELDLDQNVQELLRMVQGAGSMSRGE